jgi:hypothetical protein
MNIVNQVPQYPPHIDSSAPNIMQVLDRVQASWAA